MKTVKLISVFISCPSDMNHMRDCLVAYTSEINMNLRQEGVSIRVEAVHMDNAVFSGTGKTGQAVFDDQIGEYDVYIGLMKNKFGSRVGAFGSGTQHEYELALRAKHEGRCNEVGFLFDPDNSPPEGLPPKALIKFAKDLGQVNKFKNSLHSDGVLTYFCSSDNEFYRHFRGLINNAISRVKIEISPRGMAENSLKTIFATKNVTKS